MVEVDYPHSDTTWPDSQALLHQRFSGSGQRLSDGAIADLTYRTAAHLFRAPLPPHVS
jgi:hypothetical protein